MFNMEYKKINLRDFRHNLSEVRDSGYAYTILKKGEVYGYFVPAEYEIQISKKKSEMTQERFREILENIRKHPFEFKDEVKDAKDGKEAYHRLLDIKYGKYE
jgi:hypothetical protein